MEINELANLKYLYLSGNQLKSIPENIQQLQNLKWLGLGRNQITELPKSLFNLPNLEWLDISENPITPEKVEEIRKQMPHIKVVFEGEE